METTFEEQKKLERVRKKVKSIKGFYKHLIVYILVNAFLFTISYTNLKPTEHFISFDTFRTAFFWGLGLAFHAFGVFGTDIFLGTEWEDRKIKEMMEKDRKNRKMWE